jgi:hypothetical protein
MPERIPRRMELVRPLLVKLPVSHMNDLAVMNAVGMRRIKNMKIAAESMQKR